MYPYLPPCRARSSGTGQLFSVASDSIESVSFLVIVGDFGPERTRKTRAPAPPAQSEPLKTTRWAWSAHSGRFVHGLEIGGCCECDWSDCEESLYPQKERSLICGNPKILPGTIAPTAGVGRVGPLQARTPSLGAWSAWAKNPFPSKIPTQLGSPIIPPATAGLKIRRLETPNSAFWKALIGHRCCGSPHGCHTHTAVPPLAFWNSRLSCCTSLHGSRIRGSFQIGEIDCCQTRQPVNVDVHVPSPPVPGFPPSAA